MRPRYGVSLGFAALVALALVIWWPASPPPAPTPTLPGAPAARAEVLRHSYHLRLRATTDVALTAGAAGADPSAPSAVSGRVDIDGTLTVTELGPRRFVARLGPVDKAAVTLLGAALPAGVLDGAAALVTLDADGGVVEIAYDPATAEVARPLLRTVIGEIGPLRYEPTATGAGARASMFRASMFGEGPLSEVVVEPGARLREHRGYERLRFAPSDLGAPEVAGRWTITTDAGGRLEGLVGGERVTVRDGAVVLAAGRSQIALSRASSGRVDAAATRQESARFVAKQADERGERSPSAARAALEQRAGGMSFARLAGDLRTYGDAGRMPDHADWLWRATGWLKLHPEEADALVTEVLASELHVPARALVLDLLANVGHAQAQAALRRLLDAPEMMGDAAWPELMQHVVLLPAPDAETVAWLGARYADAATPERRLAVAPVLGSAAGKLAGAGDVSAALAARGPLLADLAAATEVAERATLLDALGNAGLSEDGATMQGWARSDAPELRAAAARGLRKMAGGAAQDALLALVADPSAAVAREALRALSTRAPGPEALDALRELVESGALRAAAHGSLIALAARARGADTEVAALLAAVAASERAPRDVRALAAQRRLDLGKP